jgi:hypothetical protein
VEPYIEWNDGIGDYLDVGRKVRSYLHWTHLISATPNQAGSEPPRERYYYGIRLPHISLFNNLASTAEIGLYFRLGTHLLETRNTAMTMI